jgi:membrane protein required for colicin V production
MSHSFTFNWVDYVIFSVILISMLISFLRGFVKEAISLFIWLAAIIVALKFAAPVGDLFSAYVQSETARFVIAFIALFIGVILVGILLNAVIRAILDKSGLSIVDRFLGVIFGFARGVLLVSMILMFVQMSALSDNSVLKASWSINKLEPFVGWLNSFVPRHVGKVSKWLDKDVVAKGISKVTSDTTEQKQPDKAD